MRKKTERSQDDGGLRRKAALLASVLMLIALSVGSVFGDRGILSLLGERLRLQQLAQEIESLRGENHRLAAEVEALRTNPRAIERLAREELGLARPDETVFLIPDSARMNDR
ncbi:MAG: septum formation initiator family protein [Vicinamibacteria bacterium]|nr:septum formation initiator family protein [Vicinamibacteria bacterium]